MTNNIIAKNSKLINKPNKSPTLKINTPLRLAKFREGDLPLNVCIQINWHQEYTKLGIQRDVLSDMVDTIAEYPNLKLRGLMVLPKHLTKQSAQLAALAEIGAFYRTVASRYHLDTLSMGTSNDFQSAIAHGATMVRLGTAIFGKRDKLT